jgi:hypothetical protein
MAADFSRQMFSRIVEKISDNDKGTFIGQAASAGRAKAARAAGYKNSFPGHSTGSCLIHCNDPHLLSCTESSRLEFRR